MPKKAAKRLARVTQTTRWSPAPGLIEDTVHNGHIPGQASALLAAYAAEEAVDAVLRDVTARHQHQAIAAWLFALDLSATAFASDPVADAANTPPAAADPSAALRGHVLASAVRAAKPTLDLILAGYYREAWALEATMVDEWAQAVYLRVQPEARLAPGCAPTWRETSRAIAARGSAPDRALLAEATSRWDFLAVAVRPLSDQLAPPGVGDPEGVLFRPAYQEEQCALALGCGLFIQCALLAEVATLGGHPAEWDTWHRTFAEVADPLNAASRREIERWTRDHLERCSRARTALK